MSVADKLASSLDDLVKSERANVRKTQKPSHPFNKKFVKVTSSTKSTGARTSSGITPSLDMSLDEMAKQQRNKTHNNNNNNKPNKVSGINKNRGALGIGKRERAGIVSSSSRVSKEGMRKTLQNNNNRNYNNNRLLFSGDGKRSSRIGANRNKIINSAKTAGGRPPKTSSSSALRSVSKDKTKLTGRANLTIQNKRQKLTNVDRIRSDVKTSPSFVRRDNERQRRQSPVQYVHHHKYNTNSSIPHGGDEDFIRPPGFAYNVGRVSSATQRDSSHRGSPNQLIGIHHHHTQMDFATAVPHVNDAAFVMSAKDRKSLPKIKVVAQLEKVPNPLPIQEHVRIRMPKEVEEMQGGMINDQMINDDLMMMLPAGPKQMKLSDRFSANY